MVTRMGAGTIGRAAVVTLFGFTLGPLSACVGGRVGIPTPAPPAPAPSPAVPVAVAPPSARLTDSAWADSVLATLSLRDKVAQMVWPWMLGDYTADDDAAFQRIARLIRDQHLGGLIISVGSPTEIAAKLNALQSASTIPLLVGADLETGAAFRARGGYFLTMA